MRKFYGALLICLILPVLLFGCRKAPDNRDPFKAADSTTATSEQTAENRRGETVVQAAEAARIDRDVMEFQTDLEGFSEDIEQLENIGVENAASEMDRELDGF